MARLKTVLGERERVSEYVTFSNYVKERKEEREAEKVAKDQANVEKVPLQGESVSPKKQEAVA